MGFPDFWGRKQLGLGEQRALERQDELNKGMHRWDGDESPRPRRSVLWPLLGVVAVAIAVAIFLILASR